MPPDASIHLFGAAVWFQHVLYMDIPYFLSPSFASILSMFGDVVRQLYQVCDILVVLVVAVAVQQQLVELLCIGLGGSLILYGVACWLVGLIFSHTKCLWRSEGGAPWLWCVLLFCLLV